MSINCGSLVLPWVFLIGWMQDPKEAPDAALANIPARHGVAITWVWPGISCELVYWMLPRDGGTITVFLSVKACGVLTVDV